MNFFDTQNPGIGGLDELTTEETIVVQNITALGDPNADRILFWDDSANAYAFLTVGSGLTITDTTITATAGSIDGSGTTNELTYWVDANTLGSLAVATYPSLTELSYVKGVTSGIQSQLNAKGSGTVTAIGVTTANGVSGSSSGGATPNLTIVLGDITPTSVTASKAGLSGSFTNTTDTASNQGLIIQSDRATPANNDEIYQSFKLSDSAGNQDEFARITTIATDVTSTSEDSKILFSYMIGGVLTAKLRLLGTVLGPDANDGLALGTATTSWSDIFLADGGVINFNNGNATLTHSAGLLTSNVPVSLGTSNALTAGTIELGNASDTTISRSAAGKIAVEGVDVLTVAGGTMTGNITLGENTSIDLDPAGSADGKYSGICITGTAGATLAFGDLIYLAVADSRWELTDADATATSGTPLIGMCVLAAAGDGSATKILLQGTIRADAKFPTLTVGAPAYVGETAGAIQTAIPTGADNVIRVVGRALTADELYFCPSQDHQVTVA